MRAIILGGKILVPTLFKSNYSCANSFEKKFVPISLEKKILGQIFLGREVPATFWVKIFLNSCANFLEKKFCANFVNSE